MFVFMFFLFDGGSKVIWTEAYKALEQCGTILVSFSGHVSSRMTLRWGILTFKNDAFFFSFFSLDPGFVVRQFPRAILGSSAVQNCLS